MKSDIILAGVGGQGILSIAAVIGKAALEENLHLKQAEVHGMSQRGGAVQSHLRLSSSPVFSDLIPAGKADMIVSVEPMESLRYLTYLGPEAWLITNFSPFINIPDYPEAEKLKAEIEKIKNHIIIDADKLAREAGSPRATNMVILGAASVFISMEENSFLEGVKTLFHSKGEDIIRMNTHAFQLGRAAAQDFLR